MTELRRAAEQALKYFEDAYGLEDTEVAIREALRQALAQPEQEPVGYAHVEDLKREHHDFMAFWVNRQQGVNEVPLYTAPPKREWVGLTDEEVADYWVAAFNENGLYVQTFASLIEAKLKEKNAESLQKVKNNLQKGKKDETRRGWHRGNRTVSQGHSKERHPTHVKAR